jgi:hypothetical protein
MATRRFIGGPLDDQTVAVRGRPCCYRDAAGRPISTSKGDRTLFPNGRKPLAVPGVYLLDWRDYAWHRTPQAVRVRGSSHWTPLYMLKGRRIVTTDPYDPEEEE